MTAPIIILAWHGGALVGADEIDLGSNIEALAEVLAENAAGEAAASEMLDRLAADDRPYPAFLECWHSSRLLWRKSPREIILAASQSGCLLARELDDLDVWRDATEEAGK